MDKKPIVKGPQSDYLVLTMTRPAGYDKKYAPCAGGMGESRAYLISIVAGKATVVDRDFGGDGRTKPVRYLVRYPMSGE